MNLIADFNNNFITNADLALDDAITDLHNISNIDLIPGKYLDYIAQNVNCIFWHKDLSDKMKRELIKQSIYCNKHRGTNYVVSIILGLCGLNGIVIENSDKAKVIFIKLNTASNEQVHYQKREALFLRLIDSTKPLSVHYILDQRQYNDISVSMRCSFCVTQIVNLSGGNKDDSK